VEGVGVVVGVAEGSVVGVCATLNGLASCDEDESGVCLGVAWSFDCGNDGFLATGLENSSFHSSSPSSVSSSSSFA
jgi:hypothetical protein